ncbi:stage II sporulation protein R [Natribacillus halophilus]|uniref:Stage II sporulation protein R n=1 Tax=Natribacillus halophilus TaxID=549003 RepID=A0A1G8KV62_9BACI|nr:stage II sporulation protein R [Natribacillus halophilus]SDI47276.1 stage II sporulation protein R [Natribacillus halophilus]
MKSAIIYVFIGLFLVVGNWESQQQHWPEEDPVPEDSLRLRIFSHDDSLLHQQIKQEVRDEVAIYSAEHMEDVPTKEEAREVFAAHLDTIEEKAEDIVHSYDPSMPVDVSLDEDVAFPTKVYGPLVYPAGDYEALVVDIGDGEGENWWCVLFPPLCLTDLGIGEEEDEEEQEDHESEEVDENEPEFTFFLAEVWEDWFSA